MDMNKTIINFCPTGMVPTSTMNPNTPIQVNEVIEQTHEAYELGITIAHVHARNIDETPTYKASIYQKIFEGIRKHCPELIICGSTSGRNFSEFEKRSQVIELQPDMCSLTLSSFNFINQASMNSPKMIIALAEKMKKYGVVPELECFDLGMINYGKYLISKGIVEGPFYWNILFNNIAGSQCNLSHLGVAVDSIPVDHYVSLAGLGNQQLAVNTIAIAANFGVRVGIEDNIWHDQKKSIKASNKALLERIHHILNLFEKQYMPGAELGKKGFYNRKLSKVTDE
jgi:uncharacterized protein (DUF849 family)